MSLPVRRPPSRSPLSTSPQNTHCADSTTQPPEKKTYQPQTPRTKTAIMSQTNINSSPLSPVPETPPVSATPPTSSPSHSQHPPEDPTKDEIPTPTSEGTMADTLTPLTSEPTMSLTSSTANGSDVAKKNKTRLSSKRGREGDNGEDSPPSKKSTVPAKSKAKAKPAPKKSAAKKAAPPPRQPSSRPSRNRKAPERFEEFQETKSLKELPVKKAASKVFDPVYITTNSTSRLAKADIYHMLLEPTAWSSLTSEQQATLVSMLPSTSANTAILTAINSGVVENPRPQAFTISNNCFRTDVAKFQEDLKNGHLAKTWQAAAEQAVIERAAGKYDAWKAEEAELWWGQKSNPSK
ncbi:Asx homology domain-containing protein [Phaeosphaeria sp. MPI-PUGE-AT-0046c]|nr:Asx homology domain-containing protein [Phaeosphaeria sp. MPI-PUGE-AT-0046c]